MMMTTSLDRTHIIEKEQLNSDSYFQSLLEQAHSKGILSDPDVERLQYECIGLLAYKTERYNAGDSSSIRVEKAQEIMTSILFTIGLWLKTYANPDDAVIVLQREPIQDLYKKGRLQINAMLDATKAVHTKLRQQLMDTPNVFYRETLEKGISGFFKLYDPDYSAQDIHITADYPLFNPVPKLAGIEFIKAYVEAAYYENRFCSYFSADDIHHLLCGYAEDYQEHLLNIYEFVLTVAIGCIISGMDCSHLDITEAGKTFLIQTFSKQAKSEQEAAIFKAANELNRRFHFSPELMQYIQYSLPIIASKIEVVSREHTLDSIFFTPAFPEYKTKIVFSFGDKMDDEPYRKLIEEIGQCHYSQDKIAIIKEHIRSLSDLEDVLLDADLCQEEIQTVLHELSLQEIAALSKKYQLASDLDAFELRDQEQVLRTNLKDFISALPPTQQEWIKQVSKIMQEK
jgi:hypothetical protein